MLYLFFIFDKFILSISVTFGEFVRSLRDIGNELHLLAYYFVDFSLSTFSILFLISILS